MTDFIQIINNIIDMSNKDNSIYEESNTVKRALNELGYRIINSVKEEKEDGNSN